MSGFPRAHLICPRSSPGFHPRSLPVFSSLFHFRRPPFPGQLFFTTIFMKTHFQARFFRRPPSLSPSPFPVFRSRFQECPIFGPVFTNARFFDPVFKNARIFGPAFKNSPIYAQFFWKSPIFVPVFQDYALFWPWSYSIATVAVAIIL